LNEYKPDAEIYIDGRYYHLYIHGPLKKYPYMVDRETGEIPEGFQRPMLKEYLIRQGVDIEPWKEKTTHWCIKAAVKASGH
jgi:hypothetical protein